MALFPPSGLACHPRRPFTMASCSRDSTVRLWSLTPLITPLQINILADRSWEEIIGNTGMETLHVLDLLSKYDFISALFSELCLFSRLCCRTRHAPSAVWQSVKRYQTGGRETKWQPSCEKTKMVFRMFISKY